MYWKLILLSFVLSITSNGFSQSIFSGKLLDINSNNPVGDAFLYIDGTTHSTVSNADGNFMIALDKIPSKVEISHLSYEPKTINLNSLKRDTTIFLQSRVFTLNEVTVSRKRINKDYLRRFRQEFLGEDKWGLKAKLVNEEALIFLVGDTSFQVSATAPLLVELPDLGYDLQIELREFIIRRNAHFNTESTSVSASYFFISHEKINNKIKSNRISAYYNSRQHFLKALYDNELAKNGFRVFLGIEDSLKHTYTYDPVSLGDSLIHIDLGVKLINQKGKKFELFYYHDNKGNPIDLTKDKQGPNLSMSSVYFEEDFIPFYSDGTSPKPSIIFMGSIGIKRIGTRLPSDFIPTFD